MDTDVFFALALGQPNDGCLDRIDLGFVGFGYKVLADQKIARLKRFDVLIQRYFDTWSGFGCFFGRSARIAPGCTETAKLRLRRGQFFACPVTTIFHWIRLF